MLPNGRIDFGFESVSVEDPAEPQCPLNWLTKLWDKLLWLPTLALVMISLRKIIWGCFVKFMENAMKNCCFRLKKLKPMQCVFPWTFQQKSPLGHEFQNVLHGYKLIWNFSFSTDLRHALDHLHLLEECLFSERLSQASRVHFVLRDRIPEVQWNWRFWEGGG